MNAANIAALITGITALISAVTGLIIAVQHIRNHDSIPAGKPVEMPVNSGSVSTAKPDNQ